VPVAQSRSAADSAALSCRNGVNLLGEEKVWGNNHTPVERGGKEPESPNQREKKKKNTRDLLTHLPCGSTELVDLRLRLHLLSVAYLPAGT
jgi:hypothetical protein